MRSEDLKSIDDYEGFLHATLEAWSPEQRVAFAAAMADRWLPTYEAFSAREQWGDPDNLHRILEAVWHHVQGRTLTPANLARYERQLQDSTPHMDDFDAYEALAACSIISYALDCCGTADNAAAAVGSALAGFEAAVPDWPFEPAAHQRLWRQVAARRELKPQLWLVERIGSTAHFDEATIKGLRGHLTGPELVGQVSPKSPSTAGLGGLTNQVAFEQYRRMVQADIRGQNKPPDPAGDPVIFATMFFSFWLGRYSRRRDTIEGNYGKLADVEAQRALIARNRARDKAEERLPDWDPRARRMIDISMQNCFSLKVIDVGSLDQPHGYGPSLRFLWGEAKRLGRSDLDAWNNVLAWSRHRPAAWELEDRRMKKGLAHGTPALAGHLARGMTWTASGDVDHPWVAQVDGERWMVRVNDFPDDLMYSLVIGAEDMGSFHDWPETWQRG